MRKMPEAWEYPIWQMLYGIRENPAQPERWHTMFYWDLLVFFGTDAVENRSAQEVEETRKIFETMRDIHLANLPEIIRWVVH
uniref:hypothetical protein n=1 Tax=Faecalicatena contorta TaxID=39482 RepID=UPI00359CAAA2